MMAVGMIMPVSAEEANTDFAGEELSILVSQGWMDNRYDETIARFEETYDVTVDLQTIPADQYFRSSSVQTCYRFLCRYFLDPVQPVCN